MTTPERYDRIREVFLEARELDPDDRPAFLDRVCEDDDSLRQEVERFLEGDDRGEAFLEPAAEHGGRAETAAAQSERAGDRVGEYELVEKIGEGGFGTVWRAVQHEPVRLEVAIKIIKLGMDTKQVIARFESERRTLAMMTHPGIAKVLGAGSTPSGRPYFAMELVNGLPITRFCDEHRLGTHERIELFAQVCKAVQHAHQKGVIHRDISASNVLVEMNDGTPTPKVIDFGIAKATDQESKRHTILTGAKQVIGNPAYMSPEQAELSNIDIDTRSDIYSLGVLLYELLTGTTPFDDVTLVKAGLGEMLRVIREETPSKPSTRLSSLGGAASRTASFRGVGNPARLVVMLRGELDWIVMKCLEKERARRYDSASDLAGDLGRYLADEPVQARPPSAWYRLRKFTRRHRPSVVAACLVLLTLLVSVPLLSWQNAELKRQQLRAARARLPETLTDVCRDPVSSLVTFDSFREQWGSLAPGTEALRLRALKITAPAEEWSPAFAAYAAEHDPASVAPGLLVARADYLLFDSQDPIDEDPLGLLRKALESDSLADSDRLYARALLADSARASLHLLDGALDANPFHVEAQRALLSSHLLLLDAQAAREAVDRLQRRGISVQSRWLQRAQQSITWLERGDSAGDPTDTAFSSIVRDLVRLWDLSPALIERYRIDTSDQSTFQSAARLLATLRPAERLVNGNELDQARLSRWIYDRTGCCVPPVIAVPWTVAVSQIANDQPISSELEEAIQWPIVSYLYAKKRPNGDLTAIAALDRAMTAGNSVLGAIDVGAHAQAMGAMHGLFAWKRHGNTDPGLIENTRKWMYTAPYESLDFDKEVLGMTDAMSRSLVREYDFARSVLDRMRSAHPNKVDVIDRQLILCDERQGLWHSALSRYAAYLERNPDDAEMLDDAERAWEQYESNLLERGVHDTWRSNGESE